MGEGLCFIVDRKVPPSVLFELRSKTDRFPPQAGEGLHHRFFSVT
jgi:hypothetical protein